MATFALVMTVGTQPRPARSTRVNLAALRTVQLLPAFLTGLIDKPCAIDKVRWPGFLVSMSTHGRTPLGVGDTRACFSHRIAKDAPHDRDIHSLRHCHAMLRPRTLLRGNELTSKVTALEKSSLRPVGRPPCRWKRRRSIRSVSGC